MIIVIAGSYKEAQDWANANGEESFLYPEYPEALQGIHDVEFVRVGSWRNRTDLREIDEMLSAVRSVGVTERVLPPVQDQLLGAIGPLVLKHDRTLKYHGFAILFLALATVALNVRGCPLTDAAAAPLAPHQVVEDLVDGPTPKVSSASSIEWQPVTKNSDGSDCEDLAGYEVLVVASGEPPVVSDGNSLAVAPDALRAAIGSLLASHPNDADLDVYCRAFDDAGNSSAWSRPLAVKLDKIAPAAPSEIKIKVTVTVEVER